MKQDAVTAAPPSRITVRDLAAATGVSVATISRVLNNHGNVAEPTARRVREAVDRLGAQAPVPRGPVARRETGSVFVRCPYQLTDYFGLIVSSVAETLQLHGRPMLLHAGEAAVSSDVLAELPSRRDIAGAVLILPPEPVAALRRLRERSFPYVVLDPRVPVPRDTLAVSAAHATGSGALTQHLLELGHRRIGVISGERHWLASESRLSGHIAALAEVRVLSDPALIRYGEPSIATGYRAGGELLDLAEPPTAIMGFNDKTAVGVLQAAAERGLSVPGELSVTGFDDLDISRATIPALTTTRQPLAEMGRMAVTLLERVLARHAVQALHVELATELVVRGSTGRLFNQN